MRLIRLKEVQSCSGLARSTIYKHISEGTFPSPVPISERAVAWVESEVMDWIQSKIDCRVNGFSKKKEGKTTQREMACSLTKRANDSALG